MEKYQKYLQERDYLAALCDIKLITNDGWSFDVHRFALAKKSVFFRNLFSLFRNDREPIIIPFRGETLNEVLYFIYTDLVDFNEGNFLEILITADFLHIEDLYSLAKKYAESKLSVENCIKIYATSTKINEHHLSQLSFRIIQMNFEAIRHQADFVEIPLYNLIEILKDNSLLVSGENVIWESIKKWINTDQLNRLKEVCYLIKCLKIDDIDGPLAQEIIESDLICKNSYCSELVKNTSNNCNSVKYILNSYLESSEKDLSACQRLPKCMHLIICAESEESNSDSEHPSIYITYDEKLDFWRKLGKFEDTEFRFSASYVVHIVADKIYAFDFSRSVAMIFSLCEKKWQVMENFLCDIKFRCSVVIGKNIYFISNVKTSDIRRQIVKKYNVENELWSEVMPMFRFAHFKATALLNKIFVLGRENDLDLRMSVQVYEEEANSWSFISQPSIFRRYHFHLTAYHNKLYVIGGKDSNGQFITSVEVFDPFGNEWSRIDDLPLLNVYCTYKSRSLIVNDQMFFISRYNPQLVLSEKTEKSWVKPVKRLPTKYFNYTFEETLKFHSIHNKYIINILSKQNREPQAFIEKSRFQW